MKAPSYEQLREYADAIGFTEFDPQEFLDHYDANGWRVGKTRMVNWQATVRTWRSHHRKWQAEREQRNQPRKQVKAVMPIALRNKIINRLNEKKKRIMRTFPTGNYAQWAKDALANIERQLSKL